MSETKVVTFRLDAGLYADLQTLATELGVNLSEYLRLMACLPFPYLPLVVEVGTILQRAEADPDAAISLRRAALARLEAGEAEITALLARIQPSLPPAQQASRAQVAEVKALLQGQLQELGHWAEAFQTLRKRLVERHALGQEGTP
jgi:hypothetical protein